MSSDLYLDENTVITRGHRLRLEGEDLEIRSADRTRAGGGDGEPRRRALVHGFQDQLVVNYKGDYKETEMHGTVRVRQGAQKPPVVYVMDGRGDASITLFGPKGLVSCEDLTAPLPWAGGQRVSLVETVKWLHRRVRALEEEAGVEGEDFPIDDRRG